MKNKLILLGLLIGAICFMGTTSVREARVTSKLTVTENLVSPTTSSYWDINGLDQVIIYSDGGTRNDVDNVYADTVLGDGNLNLTALTNTLGQSLDLTGDAVMAIKFSLQDDAGATCTISNATSTSYPLGGTTYSWQLKANQSMLFICDTVLSVVSSSLKLIKYDSSNDTTALSVILISADVYN